MCAEVPLFFRDVRGFGGQQKVLVHQNMPAARAAGVLAVVLAGRSTPSGATGQDWGVLIGIPGEPIVWELGQPEASEFVNQVFR